MSDTSKQSEQNKNTEADSTPNTPLHTSHGVTTIDENVIAKIAGMATREVPGVYSMGNAMRRAFTAMTERIPTAQTNVTGGINVQKGETQTSIEVTVVVDYGAPIIEVTEAIDQATGAIWLSGPMLATGYLGDEELTKRCFVSRPQAGEGTRDAGETASAPESTEAGATRPGAEAGAGGPGAGSDVGAGEPARRWFITSDRGQIVDGRLQVLGRLDDVIISGGIKVEPGPIEALLALNPLVSECAVVGLPDLQWGQAVTAVVVPASMPGLGRVDEGAILAQIRVYLEQKLSGAQCPKQVLLADALPYKGIGKVDRRALAQSLARA